MDPSHQQHSDTFVFRQVFRRLLPYAWRYRGRILLVLFLSILVPLGTKVTILFADPVLKLIFPGGNEGHSLIPKELPKIPLVSNLVESARSWFLQMVYGMQGTPAQDQFMSIFARIFVLILSITLITAIGNYLFIILSRNLSLRMIVDLRRDVCAHLLRLSMRYHGEKKMGDLLSRLTRDGESALRSVSIFFEDLLQMPFMILFTVTNAIYASPILTFAILLIIPLVAIPISFFARKVRRGSYRSATAMGSATTAMEQMLSGIRVVKAFQMEDREIENIDQANRNFVRKTMQMVRAKAASQSFLQIFTMGGTAVALFGIGVLENRYQAFGDIGRATIFMSAIALMYTHVRQMTRFWYAVLETSGPAMRLIEILDRKPEIETRKGAVQIAQVQQSIEVKNLSFAYESDQVLQNVSFTAKAGSRVAFVGPSGAGKSTLLDLLARFYDPTHGSIFVDSKDLRSLDLNSWLRQIAIVNQDPFLFNTSIGENIRYGRPAATLAEIEAAAQAAQIHEFVCSLPQGYETLVGERGTRLSGGQLQRITIARAILKNASVLLLDEATSSLDSESERAVQQALDNLMQGKTTFVIAHRLSTIRHADQILVLDYGKLVETGTHQELLAKGGVYKRLHDVQFAEISLPA